jgi:hypothetical protein
MTNNLSVYIATLNGMALLYTGPEKKVNEFLKFWTQFRPRSTIEVRAFDKDKGVFVKYKGESVGYPNSRR